MLPICTRAIGAKIRSDGFGCRSDSRGTRRVRVAVALFLVGILE